MGVILARRNNMDEVYRAADILLSPQKIATRTVGESLSCGTPVIANLGCHLATYQTDVSEPQKISDCLCLAVRDLKNKKDEVIRNVSNTAKAFSLSAYSNEMNKIYNQII